MTGRILGLVGQLTTDELEPADGESVTGEALE